MSLELKIRAKELAQEARYIRKEENKCIGKMHKFTEQGNEKASTNHEADYFRLNHHRKTTVREAARVVHLARAYMAGRRCSDVDAMTLERDDIWYEERLAKKVARTVLKYEDTHGRWYDRIEPKEEKVALMVGKIMHWFET